MNPTQYPFPWEWISDTATVIEHGLRQDRDNMERIEAPSYLKNYSLLHCLDKTIRSAMRLHEDMRAAMELLDEIRRKQSAPLGETAQSIRIVHGVNCPEAPHAAGHGYLHNAGDPSPYDVDGVIYCGRCHEHIGFRCADAPL